MKMDDKIKHLTYKRASMNKTSVGYRIHLTFDQNVNLGNISPTDVLPLETLRQGLRGDTFFNFLPKDIIKKRKPT